MVELYRTRNGLGYEPIYWSVLNSLRPARSGGWVKSVGTVESYEVLATRNGGWLAILYSYSFGDHSYSGEFRRCLGLSLSLDSAATKVIGA